MASSAAGKKLGTNEGGIVVKESKPIMEGESSVLAVAVVANAARQTRAVDKREAIVTTPLCCCLPKCLLEPRMAVIRGCIIIVDYNYSSRRKDDVFCESIGIYCVLLLRTATTLLRGRFSRSKNERKNYDSFAQQNFARMGVRKPKTAFVSATATV